MHEHIWFVMIYLWFPQNDISTCLGAYVGQQKPTHCTFKQYLLIIPSPGAMGIHGLSGPPGE